MSAELFARQVALATLRADAGIQALTAWSGHAGQYRIFGGDYVHEAVPHPYIVIRQWSGGWVYGAVPPGIDMQLLIVAETELSDDEHEAVVVEDWQAAIGSALQMQTPVIPDSLEDQFRFGGLINEIFPHHTKYLRQNRHYLRRGGVYRFKLDPA